MKPSEQYFSLVLFIMLHKVVLNFENVKGIFNLLFNCLHGDLYNKFLTFGI